MKIQSRIVIALNVLALLSFGVHAGTKVTSRDEIVTGKVPRPAHIWVYDFAATADDLPSGSALAKENVDKDSSQTPEDVAAGRQLGADIASELVREIQSMGLPAELATADTKPGIDDIVIHGQLVSYSEGSEKKRVLIGLGAGESELKAAVEGYEVTDQGLRRLGQGDTESTAGKTPGIGVGALTTIATHNPLGLIVSTGIKRHDAKKGTDKLKDRAKDTAKEIADVLKERFQQQGWIEGS